MDWKTLLASGVIAAIVSGLMELFKLKHSNTARYVIKQREEWREKVRGIADEIYSSDKKTIGATLVKLKTRINPYGKFNNIVFINSHERKNLNKNERKRLTKKEDKQESYYLEDSHIWNLIEKIEKEAEIEQHKTRLIEYLSCLVKFDWERAKIEASINRAMIFSAFLEVFAIALMIFDFGSITSKNIFPISVLIILYIFPHLTIAVNDSQSVLIKGKLYRSIVSMILVLVSFLFVIVAIAVLFNNQLMGWALILSAVAILIQVTSIEHRSKTIKDYVSMLEQIDKK